MRRHFVISAVFWAALLSASPELKAEVYRVGPDEPNKSVSSVSARLQPGDVVEIAGDIRDTVTLGAHGLREKPIIVRGVTRVENGRFIRPRIEPSLETARAVVSCYGNHYIIEGLDIGGAPGRTMPAIRQECDDLTVRNCRFHHHRKDAFTVSETSGTTVLEFCEFDSNGSDARSCTVNAWSRRKDGELIIRHCWFHNTTNGTVVKSRSNRNVIACNWFESPYHSVLKLIDPNERTPYEEPEVQYPMHSDIAGNVFCLSDSPGPMFAVLQLGGEGPQSPGTEGDFNIAHNLFVIGVNRPADDPVVVVLVHGNVDRVNVYNNALFEYAVGAAKFYERGTAWDTARTQNFVSKRGGGEPVVKGANNWTTAATFGIPEEFENTLKGDNPKFVDLLDGDFRPRADSPLAGAGLEPLPRGATVALTPEFEPQRGIPPDLKPRPRRKAVPPSVGPFEAAP